MFVNTMRSFLNQMHFPLCMDLEALTKGYSAWQQAHPIVGNIAAAAVIFPLADAVTQKIENGYVNTKKVVYTLKTSPLLGVAMYGLMEMGNAIGRTIDDSAYLSSVYGPNMKAFIQSALGPNCFGNLMNGLFFFNNSVGKKSNYMAAEPFLTYATMMKDLATAPRKFVEICKERIEREPFLKSTALTLIMWNGIQTANFMFVPEHLRGPVSLAFSLPTAAALSLWSLRGNRRVPTEAVAYDLL